MPKKNAGKKGKGNGKAPLMPRDTGTIASFNVREWTARARACVCVISVCVGGMKWRYLDPNYLAITASNREEISANCIQQIQILLLIVSSQ